MDFLGANRGPLSGTIVTSTLASVLGVVELLHAADTIILDRFKPLEIYSTIAILYLLIWFAMQLYLGISSGPSAPLLGGVAWWAHVGGFLFGVAAAPLMAGKPVKRRRAPAKARSNRKP